MNRLRGRRVAVLNWRDPWHHLAGGSERYAWELASALRDAGARVEFWTARDRHDGIRQSTRARVDGIDVLRAGGTFGFYPLIVLRLLARRLSRARRPSLVVDMDCGIPLFSPLALGRRTPVVLVVHHVHLDQFATHFRRPLADVGRLLEAWLMPVVYRNVRTLAVSESTVTEMRERLSWRGPVEVVPNGTYSVASPVDPAAGDPDRVVVLGRLVPHKRVDAVIAAVARIRQRRPSLRLDIVGDGPERERLDALVAELGLGDRVRLLGFVPDTELGSVLTRARLHVCASDAEGWGLVVVEAAAHGVPSLARDVPGLRDSVRNGETGWLLAREVTLEELDSALAEAIIGALDELEDEAVRTRFAGRCREWAGRFTWPDMRGSVVVVAEDELERSRRGCSSNHPSRPPRRSLVDGRQDC